MKWLKRNILKFVLIAALLVCYSSYSYAFSLNTWTIEFADKSCSIDDISIFDYDNIADDQPIESMKTVSIFTPLNNLKLIYSLSLEELRQVPLGLPPQK